MYQRGIRGAITIEENTIEAVKDATIELISEMKKQNNYDEKDISNVIFTLTEDIDCVYPAKIAREEFIEWKYVPMMCFNELDVPNAIKMCSRVLIVVNCGDNFEPEFVYLDGAENLRK